MRKHGRRDENHQEVIRLFRQMGATVADLGDQGSGYPDILCGIFGVTHCVEIKDGKKPPSKRRLTLQQETWRDSWRGDYAVVTSPEEAMKLIVEWEKAR